MFKKGFISSEICQLWLKNVCLSSLTIILILLTTTKVTAQSDSLNYFEYHKKINEAELFIAIKSYDKAFEKYQEAFLKLELPFSKDIHNATICALQLNKMEEVLSLFYRLVSKGVKFEYFSSKMFSSFHKTIHWRIFEESFPSKHKMVLAQKNIRYKNIIEKLVGKDQELTKMKDENHDFRQVFHNEVKKNEQDFIKLVKEYGFPSEDLIGIDKPGETLAFILLIHFVQIRNFEGGMDSLSEILDFAIENNQLSLYKYAYLASINNQNKIQYGPLVIANINDRYKGIRNYTANEKQLIDINRSKIGLESLDDYQQKVIFSYQNEVLDFIFNYEGAILDMHFIDDSGEKMWKDALKKGTYIPFPNEKNE